MATARRAQQSAPTHGAHGSDRARRRQRIETGRPEHSPRGLCPRQESNLHALNGHQPLKLACLPIPPPGPHGFGMLSGAQNRNRTCTTLLLLVPETSASTSSATWAIHPEAERKGSVFSTNRQIPWKGDSPQNAHSPTPYQRRTYAAHLRLISEEGTEKGHP